MTIPILPVGLWFDGTFGQRYNDLRLVDAAERLLGWKVPPEYADALARAEESANYDNTPVDGDDELLDELFSLAVEVINSASPAGHHAAWVDGDFGVWPDEGWDAI